MTSADENLKDRIQVAEDNTEAYARVFGRGSYSNSTSFKKFGRAIASKNGVNLTVDLSQCRAVDSTFMGVLVGFCDQFAKEDAGTLYITGASEALVKCMTTLGLNHLIDLSDQQSRLKKLEPNEEVATLEKSDVSDLSTAKTMLEAHQNLVEIDDANQARFKDVLDYLKKEVENKSS